MGAAACNGERLTDEQISVLKRYLKDNKVADHTRIYFALHNPWLDIGKYVYRFTEANKPQILRSKINEEVVSGNEKITNSLLRCEDLGAIASYMISNIHDMSDDCRAGYTMAIYKTFDFEELIINNRCLEERLISRFRSESHPERILLSR